MTALPARIDPTATSGAEKSVSQQPTQESPARHLQIDRSLAGDAPPLLDLGTGAVLETIVTAARRHATESGSASETRDLTNALERAVALLVPELRQRLLRSLQNNFGLAGVGEGTAGHVWRPTNYGALCDGCGFSIPGSEPRLMRALADTPCTGRYDDTAALLRSRPARSAEIVGAHAKARAGRT